MTTITSVKPIDFNDKTAITNEIEKFAEKYAYADVEHALEISPDGNAYILKGEKGNVNSEIIGQGALKSSISIHNHPVETGKDKSDSFGLKDIKFANENQQGKQYLVSGTRRDAFEFTEYYPINQIEPAWDAARYAMWKIHKANDTEVIFEQEDILRELGNYLKGFKFYENV